MNNELLLETKALTKVYEETGENHFEAPGQTFL